MILISLDILSHSLSVGFSSLWTLTFGTQSSDSLMYLDFLSTSSYPRTLKITCMLMIATFMATAEISSLNSKLTDSAD